MADDCFIYGSNHAKMPRRDAIERALGVVDYVLLEGLGTRDWRELVRSCLLYTSDAADE